MTALIARNLSLMALCLLLAPAVWADPASSSARVIVKLRSGSALLAGSDRVTTASAGAQQAAVGVPMQRLGARLGLSLQDGRALNARTHVATAIGMSSQALATRLAAQSDVEYAVVDHWRQAASVTPNDPYYAASTAQAPNPYVAVGQWYLKAPDRTLVSAINAPAAWDITTGRSSVTVAVLDTGVRFDHPDLRDKLLPGYNMISSGVIAGNGLGRTNDASDLGDWLTSQEIAAHPEVYSGASNPCKAQATSSWHGTQVAGIVGAASGNSVGMASVAGGAAILPVRVLGKCGGYDSDIMAGMLWAGGVGVAGLPQPRQAARVLNLSLGGTGRCSGYTDIVAQLAARGVVVVAAAGNSLGEAVSAPGNCPGVIAVGGVRHAGTKVGYSALGPEVALSAPSGNCLTISGNCIYPILTTTNTGATSPVSDLFNGSTYTGSGSTDASYGTSFSAPQVSGAVALMLSVRPELTPAEVAQILKNTARPFPTTGGTAGIGQCLAPSTTEQGECYCTTTTCGAGMLDVGQAVAAALVQPVAVAAVSPVAPQPGQVLSLSGSLAAPAGGITTKTYSWELVDSGGIVTLPADATTPVITFTPSGAGSFTVRLTIVDNLDNPHTTDLNVTVATPATFAAAPNPNTLGTPTTGKSSGGGGAVDGAGLLALLGFGVLAWALRVRGAGRP